ncbi:MAG TPA: extracellular solute-binding protein [Limnochordia bacterium]
MTRVFYRVACGLAIAALIWAGAVRAANIEIFVANHYPPGTPHGTLLHRYFEEYQRLHPNVQFAHSPRTTAEDISKILILFAAGTPPDIILVPQLFLIEYVNAGLVAPVPHQVARRIRSSYVPGAVALATYQGAIYGFPTENMPEAVVYNSRVFSDAGLVEQAPRTWPELRQIARKLTQRTGDGRFERAGYGILAHDTPNLAYLLTYSWGHGGDPVSSDARRVRFSDPTVIDAVDFLITLYREDQTAVLGSPGFSENKLGMFFSPGPWIAASLRRVGDTFYDGLRSALPPVGSTQERVATMYGYLWVVSKETEHPQEVYDFLFWLNTEVTEKGTTRMGDVMEALGSIPNTQADARNQPSMREPFMRGFLEALTTGVARPLPSFPSWIDSVNALAAQVVRALNGEVPPQEAMREADRIIQQKIDAFFEQ